MSEKQKMSWVSVLTVLGFVVAVVALVMGALAYKDSEDNKSKIDSTPHSGTEERPLNDVVTDSLEIVGDNPAQDPEKEYGLTISRYDDLEDGAGVRMTNGRGTRAEPLQTQANDRLAGVYMNGTRETVGVDIKNQAAIFAMAEADFTEDSCPTSLVFGVAASGSTGYTRRALLNSQGHFTPYSASDRFQDIGTNASRWDKVYAHRLLMAYDFGDEPDDEKAPYALNAYSYVGNPTGAAEPTAIRLGVLRGVGNNTDEAPLPMKDGDILSGVYTVGAYANGAGKATYTSQNQGCMRFVAEGDFTASDATPVALEFGICKAGDTSYTIATRIDSSGNYVPATTNASSLGDATHLWSVVYATDGTINTSDERQKNLVAKDALQHPGRAFIDNLDFHWWRWNAESGMDDTKKHFGPTAQGVRRALVAAVGESGDDNTYMVNTDDESLLKLSYNDVSMAGLQAVKELSEEVHRLRHELNELKSAQ